MKQVNCWIYQIVLGMSMTEKYLSVGENNLPLVDNIISDFEKHVSSPDVPEQLYRACNISSDSSPQCEARYRIFGAVG